MARKKPPASDPATPAPGGAMTDEQALAELANRPDWSLVGETIQRTFAFADFKSAMAFVDKVADAAESMNHHPDIMIRYNKVTMTLSTHDAGGITAKDFELASKMDAMV